jgi:outer membrane protein assembly factor BamD
MVLADRAIQEALQRFPGSRFEKDLQAKARSVRDYLIAHELGVGRFYLYRYDTLAALKRFRAIVRHYPESRFAPEALYRMIEATLLLGMEGEAVSLMERFKRTYPKSGWYTKAQELVKDCHLTQTKPSPRADDKA